MKKLDYIDGTYENCLSRAEIIIFVENKYENDSYARIVCHIDKCEYCAEAVSGIKMLPDAQSILTLPALWQPEAANTFSEKYFKPVLVASYVILFAVLFYLLKPSTDHNSSPGKKETLTSREYPHLKEPPVRSHEDFGRDKISASDNKPAPEQNKEAIYEKLPVREAFLLSQKENILNIPALKSTPQQNIIYLENLKIVISPALNLSKNERENDKNHIPAQYESAEKKNDEETLMASEESYNSVIIPALKKFNKAEYLSCINLLNVVLKKYPGDVNSRFYLAVSYEKNNQPEIAEPVFMRLSLLPPFGFDEETDWHLALTKFKLNKDYEARALLEKIIKGGGFYAASAKEKLESLSYIQ